MQYFDSETQENYVPFVVETSVGVDRLFFAIVANSLQEEEVPDAKGGTATRVVMKIPPVLAPIKVAVLPLLKNKEELTKKAREVFAKLKFVTDCQYDEKDAIGRRYRRQDAIGTPYCVTIDFDTLEDNTVTVRDRDTLEQIRLPIDALEGYINKVLSFNQLFV